MQPNPESLFLESFLDPSPNLQILINHNLHRSTSVIDSLRMAIGRADGHRTQNIIKQLSNNLQHMGGGMKVRGWRLII